jgi:DHA1 family inner membrane transport protein
MAFFANSAVNLLNLHYAINAVAMSGGGAFVLAYLLKAGISVSGALAALTLIVAFRFILRPLVLPAATRAGLRWLVIAGTVLGALQYPLLAEVQGMGATLIELCVLAGAGDALYWSTYHAYFAALGDDESRGRQLGAREAIAASLGVVSPLLTGWALVGLGPQAAFGATALVQVTAILPLFWTPDVPVARRRPGSFKAAIPGMLLMLANGWMAAGLTFVWRIALFVSLGEDFLAYGGALAVAALAGALGGLLLGHHIDAGRGGRALYLASFVLFATIALRAAAPGHAVLAVIANALGAVVVGLYVPTMMTPLYTLAKRSPCALRFNLATEGAWDVGCACGCLTAALLIGAGVPLSGGILLALLGAAAGFVLLRRYYSANRPVARLSVADT